MPAMTAMEGDSSPTASAAPLKMSSPAMVTSGLSASHTPREKVSIREHHKHHTPYFQMYIVVITTNHVPPLHVRLGDIRKECVRYTLNYFVLNFFVHTVIFLPVQHKWQPFLPRTTTLTRDLPWPSSGLEFNSVESQDYTKYILRANLSTAVA